MEPDRIGAGLLQIYGQRLPHNWSHFINIQHILHWGWVWMGASCSLHFNLPKRLLKFNAGPRIIEKELQKEVAAEAAAAEALVSPPIINHLVNFNAEQDSETKRSCGNYRKWTKETKEREKRRAKPRQATKTSSTRMGKRQTRRCRLRPITRSLA